MAFSTSNVKQESGGSLNWLSGDWTTILGDTSGTVTVGGARVYLCFFTNQDGTVGEDSHMHFSVSLSGALSTITVYTQGLVVTNGRFLIAYR